MSASVPRPGTAGAIARVEHGLVPAIAFEGRPDTYDIAERMAHYVVPGASIAVVHEGRIAWAKGYGFADLQHRVPVTTETLFQAGSISKVVTAMIAVILSDPGGLPLDVDVNTLLTTWKLPVTRDGAPPTLRKLLSHTAGVSVRGFRGYTRGQPLPTLRQLLDGVPPANTPPVVVDSTPGTWRYSGGGYQVVQQLVTDVTHEPFSQLAKRLIFQPLSMRHSTFDHILPSALSRKAANGYKRGNAVPGGHLFYPEMAAAGLWTTASDLAQLAVEFSHPGRALSATAVKLMTTPIINNQALGPLADGDGDARRISHTGIDDGFEASWVVYPRTGQGAVVMTNGSHALPLAAEIMRSIGREYHWPDQAHVPRRQLAGVGGDAYQHVVGNYQLGPDFRISVFVEASRLFVSAPGVDHLELYPASATRYFTDEDADLVHAFELDESGDAHTLIVEQGGQMMRAPRVR